MSRFDRRLKGGGLRPGQSTCKIRNAPSAKVMSSGFGNSRGMGGSNYATAYSPQIPGVNQGQMAQQQPEQQPDVNNLRGLSQDELGRKNRQLEQYALTAPSQELRTMTMHEIRLNNLEWINAQAEVMMEAEDELNGGGSGGGMNDIDKKIDMKFANYTLTTLEPKLKEVKLLNNNTSKPGNTPDDLVVKFRNMNQISMKMQGEVAQLKSDMKLSKATIQTFGGNLQRVHTLKSEQDKHKKELDEMRASYKKLKSDFEAYVKRMNSKNVELTIAEVERESKKMEESDVRDVVVKAIKEKSLN
jgi:hypothetical protein